MFSFCLPRIIVLQRINSFYLCSWDTQIKIQVLYDYICFILIEQAYNL